MHLYLLTLDGEAGKQFNHIRDWVRTKVVRNPSARRRDRDVSITANDNPNRILDSRAGSRHSTYICGCFRKPARSRHPPQRGCDVQGGSRDDTCWGHGGWTATSSSTSGSSAAVVLRPSRPPIWFAFPSSSQLYAAVQPVNDCDTTESRRK